MNKTLHRSLYIVLALAILHPYTVHAGVLSNFTDKVKFIFLTQNDSSSSAESETSQTLPIFKATISSDDQSAEESDDASTSDSLSARSGPLRVSTEDISYPTDDTISVYEVKKGDSLATVAKLFGVSKNTIIWANDLKSQNISPGDTLVILPMTGIKHTVKRGDTVASIARKYKADSDDISKFNGVAVTSKLSVGDVILVPEGELAVTTTVIAKSGKLITTEKLLDTYYLSTSEGFLTRPVVNGRRTQGLHGHNGIDIGATPGTPVLASASGRVIVAKIGGYNGGYGNMIVITHDNGIQTVYAHLRAVNVSPGQTVSQGQIIGGVGNTGRSTGPHLHFEVRGARNPF